ncbi:MAG TPA: hypothetical protein VJ247_02050, partial [Gaiella sp.]|nr:hypothetical protein [Gaiella sp.]
MLGQAEPQREPFYSRLRETVDALPKAWDKERPAADWIGKLTGSEASKFSKAEFNRILPHLKQAGEQKMKLTRADVMNFIEHESPHIERVTLARKEAEPHALVRGDANAGDADQIDGIGEIFDEDNARFNTDPEYLQEQIDNREARIEEIEQEIETRTEQVRGTMEDADYTLSRRRSDVYDVVEAAGLSRADVEPALEYINEHVEGEFVPRNVADNALARVMDDLRVQRSAEESLTASDYSVEEVERPTFRFEWTDREGRTHSEHIDVEPGEGEEEARAELGARFPGAFEATEEATAERVADTVEYAVKDYNDNVVDTGDDREEVMDRVVGDYGLDDGANDALWSEVKDALDSYAYAQSDYAQAESEHFWMSEGEYFQEEWSELDKLRDEIERIDTHRRGLIDNGLAQAA